MFKASSFKLQLYEQCPQRYKFEYIDKLGPEYKMPRPYLTMGAHVHNTLHDFYSKLSLAQRSWERLEGFLRLRWKENRKGFIDIEDERRWGLRALNMLKLFYQKMDIAVSPVMLEDYYEWEVDKQVSVLGRIDRVDELDGGWHVIDYKTGTFDEEVVNEFQLLLYSLIIAKRTGRDVVKASFLYLPSFTWYSIEPKPDDYDYVIEHIKLRVKNILGDHTFSPKMNRYCKNCDYLKICPAKDDVEDFLEKESRKASSNQHAHFI